MLRVGLTLLLARTVSGADHPKNAELTLSAQGAASRSTVVRREVDDDHGDAVQHRRSESGTHHRTVSIAAHSHELMQTNNAPAPAPATDSDGTTVQTTPAPLVSCGGHTAKKCAECTNVDPITGLVTLDRGPDWCHGDCTYYDGECHRLTAMNMNTKREPGYANVSTTKHVPDLLNPNITDEDRAVMDLAADASVGEAEKEAEQRLANLELQEKEKKGKLLLYIIVSCSVVLFLCAVGSVVALVKYSRKGQPKKIEEPMLAEESDDGEEGEVEYGEHGEVAATGEAPEM